MEMRLRLLFVIVLVASCLLVGNIEAARPLGVNVVAEKASAGGDIIRKAGNTIGRGRLVHKINARNAKILAEINSSTPSPGNGN
nr:hypothetical protein Itr_chr14CG30350 [Ipomoea trifida]GMD88968.1 hypothetical protein Iba_chr14cCG12240 [Ipomoea batatas]GMD91401.1 hypothetical protein Iba_chr14dCG19020 [Ipomoea batatas]